MVHLVIGPNQIKELPESFYELSKLNVLDLYQSGPEITISDKICQLWRLEVLYIDQFNLAFCPRCLEIRARSNPRFSIILK